MLHNTVARTLRDAQNLNNIQSMDNYPYLHARNCLHSGYRKCCWSKDDAIRIKIMSVLILAVVLGGAIMIARVFI